jgi:hypothetical protein
VRRLVLLALATGALALTVAGSGLAYPYSISPPTLVSVTNPFAGCTAGGPGTNYPNAEVEPFVAANGSNVVGVYQQDRWADGGAHGLVAGFSSDGGTSWGESFAAFSTCSGGTYDRASDPWVSFDTAGNAYQISLSASADLVTSAVLVSTSIDGGASWGPPATLISETTTAHFNDKESITGDPTRPGYVYAIWDRSSLPSDNVSDTALLHSFAYRGEPIFSRTTDGGATWSAPRSIAATGANLFTIGNQIAVLPDGTLVDVFEEFRGSGIQPSPNQDVEAVMRSTDGGLTWSKPIKIANASTLPVVDPDTGQPVRSGADLPDIAVDSSTGTLYVVWATGLFSGGTHDDIALSKSTDGGLTWSAPVRVNQTPNAAAAFTAAVDVSSDGSIGVTYYDFRSNTPAAGALTDYWLAHSHDGGATFSEQHVAGPFDIETAPVSRGFFLGDYEGLTHIGPDFLPFFVMTNSGDTSNRTDVFAVRATAP